MNKCESLPMLKNNNFEIIFPNYERWYVLSSYNIDLSYHYYLFYNLFWPRQFEKNQLYYDWNRLVENA